MIYFAFKRVQYVEIMYIYLYTKFHVYPTGIELKRRERVNPLNRRTLKQAPCQVLLERNYIQINKHRHGLVPSLK